jgi:hypothetical protein
MRPSRTFGVKSLIHPSAGKKRSSRKLAKQGIKFRNRHPSLGVPLDEGPAGWVAPPTKSFPLRELALLTFRRGAHPDPLWLLQHPAMNWR